MTLEPNMFTQQALAGKRAADPRSVQHVHLADLHHPRRPRMRRRLQR